MDGYIDFMVSGDGFSENWSTWKREYCLQNKHGGITQEVQEKISNALSGAPGLMLPNMRES
ncbi:MAG: hypothetical protein HKL81_02445 [Acidimicrobiaceae bacterium]|nr:hypothetical protein [Acidimicrobiaceae bacterium]